ncbi:hypothetical protein [Aquihabitans sp. McL0605]|uniref:hypothetical protein n=1 Tax=Aquihabitans sp. McL0605 TaxID=3415671 RepID=UPI003CEF9F2F
MLLLALLMAGCGSSGGGEAAPRTAPSTTYRAPDNAPPKCTAVFAEGVTTSIDLWQYECIDGDGVARLLSTAVEDCTNGRRLAHNVAGWGYLDEPWHRYPAGSERVVPRAERESCRG